MGPWRDIELHLNRRHTLEGIHDLNAVIVVLKSWTTDQQNLRDRRFAVLVRMVANCPPLQPHEAAIATTGLI